MLTQEKAERLTKFLSSNVEEAKKLFAMEPEKALEVINVSGNDFTIDELNAYCEAFKAEAMQEKGELDVGELENVSGGVVLTGGMILGLAGCFAGGAAIGIAAGAKW